MTEPTTIPQLDELSADNTEAAHILKNLTFFVKRHLILSSRQNKQRVEFWLNKADGFFDGDVFIGDPQPGFKSLMQLKRDGDETIMKIVND